MFTAMVPVGKNSAEIISAVQDIATTSGMQLTSAQVNADTQNTPGVAEKPYRVISLKLEMSGSYGSLRTFLRSLEQYVRVLNVTKIQITSGTSAIEDQLDFSVAAEAYFIK
jgi:Tfp pilus assembly protein PilO